MLLKNFILSPRNSCVRPWLRIKSQRLGRTDIVDVIILVSKLLKHHSSAGHQLILERRYYSRELRSPRYWKTYSGKAYKEIQTAYVLLLLAVVDL